MKASIDLLTRTLRAIFAARLHAATFISDGSKVSVTCAVTPSDFAVIQKASSQRFGDVVAIAVIEPDQEASASIVMTPFTARRVAAVLLDVADECDGTTPLVFHPPSPDAPR